MRHTYSLQPETIKALKTREKDVADEMNVCDRYIYAILGGSETDPFAKFVELYAAAKRAGCEVRHWDERLAAVRDRYKTPEQLCIEAEAAKYAKESTDVSVAVINGENVHTVLREAREAVAQGKRLERAALDVIERTEKAKIGVPSTRITIPRTSTTTRDQVRNLPAVKNNGGRQK